MARSDVPERVTGQTPADDLTLGDRVVITEATTTQHGKPVPAGTHGRLTGIGEGGRLVQVRLDDDPKKWIVGPPSKLARRN